MLLIAYLISYDRKHINWRLVGMGLLLQASWRHRARVLGTAVLAKVGTS
jgi:nucleoside permease NupC